MIEGAFLLLGCNLGDSLKQISKAEILISQEIGEIINTSNVYQTKAWGIENQPDFLNKVLQVSTKFSPEELLSKTQSLEKQLGRNKREKWGPREMDIDILFYNDQIINQNGLQIPHPEISKRRFTLEPLADIIPDLTHPVLNKSIQQLLAECKDPLDVKVLET